LFARQLSDDGRHVRDATRAGCQDKLAPRTLEAFCHVSTDPAIFHEMGELHLLGALILGRAMTGIAAF
jgi:glutaryl-CoA dehydrogenase